MNVPRESSEQSAAAGSRKSMVMHNSNENIVSQLKHFSELLRYISDERNIESRLKELASLLEFKSMQPHEIILLPNASNSKQVFESYSLLLVMSGALMMFEKKPEGELRIEHEASKSLHHAEAELAKLPALNLNTPERTRLEDNIRKAKSNIRVLETPANEQSILRAHVKNKNIKDQTSDIFTEGIAGGNSSVCLFRGTGETKTKFTCIGDIVDNSCHSNNSTTSRMPSLLVAVEEETQIGYLSKQAVEKAFAAELAQLAFVTRTLEKALSNGYNYNEISMVSRHFKVRTQTGIVFSVGDPSKEILILKAGRITIANSLGQKIDAIAPGNLFGLDENMVSPSQPSGSSPSRSFSAACCPLDTPCTLYYIDAAVLRSLSSPAIMKSLFTRSHRKLKQYYSTTFRSSSSPSSTQSATSLSVPASRIKEFATPMKTKLVSDCVPACTASNRQLVPAATKAHSRPSSTSKHHLHPFFIPPNTFLSPKKTSNHTVSKQTEDLLLPNTTLVMTANNDSSYLPQQCQQQRIPLRNSQTQQQLPSSSSSSSSQSLSSMQQLSAQLIQISSKSLLSLSSLKESIISTESLDPASLTCNNNSVNITTIASFPHHPMKLNQQPSVPPLIPFPLPSHKLQQQHHHHRIRSSPLLPTRNQFQNSQESSEDTKYLSQSIASSISTIGSTAAAAAARLSRLPPPLSPQQLQSPLKLPKYQPKQFQKGEKSLKSSILLENEDTTAEQGVKPDLIRRLSSQAMIDQRTTLAKIPIIQHIQSSQNLGGGLTPAAPIADLLLQSQMSQKRNNRSTLTSFLKSSSNFSSQIDISKNSISNLPAQLSSNNSNILRQLSSLILPSSSSLEHSNQEQNHTLPLQEAEIDLGKTSEQQSQYDNEEDMMSVKLRSRYFSTHSNSRLVPRRPTPPQAQPFLNRSQEDHQETVPRRTTPTTVTTTSSTTGNLQVHQEFITLTPSIRKNPIDQFINMYRRSASPLCKTAASKVTSKSPMNVQMKTISIPQQSNSFVKLSDDSKKVIQFHLQQPQTASQSAFIKQLQKQQQQQQKQLREVESKHDSLHNTSLSSFLLHRSKEQLIRKASQK